MTERSPTAEVPNATGASEQDAERPGRTADLFLYLPSWLASTVVHLALVLLLATLTFAGKGHVAVDDNSISLDHSSPLPDVQELERQAVVPPVGEEENGAPVDVFQLVESPRLETLSTTIDLVQPEAAPEREHETAADNDRRGLSNGDSLALRADDELRIRMVHEEGGTPASEAAVARALSWLAEHQYDDGHWTFQHDKSPHCNGACGNPGSNPSVVAATGLALLPFLGAGQTHVDGQFKDTVDKGLSFLVGFMSTDGAMRRLFNDGGMMYGHGLASIALCEAYGMTRDQFLRRPAQQSIDFIVWAQDPRGGGWRYAPQQAGDTSVVGWQFMALKSAQMAYLRVPGTTLKKVRRFLKSVQSNGGAAYGYVSPQRNRASTTAIGLLCRMYQGWPHDHWPLAQGVGTLSMLGPSTDSTPVKNDMYYNFYATQVMHHWGGSDWKRWNEVMREYLIKTQATDGHETGSWFFSGADRGSPAGGRLYFTAMAAMTLEVYYRHMPLYGSQSTKSMPGQ